METAIAILAIFIGIIIGVVHTFEDNKKLEIKCESLRQSLKFSPIVIECKLGQQLTVEEMELDVVAPNLVKIWRHFGLPLWTLPSITEYAEAMLSWYTPESEYTKLVIVGYLSGGDVKVSWTWEKDLKLIVTKDAVEGFQQYTKYNLGKPMLLGNWDEASNG